MDREGFWCFITVLFREKLVTLTSLVISYLLRFGAAAYCFQLFRCEFTKSIIHCISSYMHRQPAVFRLARALSTISNKMFFTY
jgi:hypothetical protein